MKRDGKSIRLLSLCLLVITPFLFAHSVSWNKAEIRPAGDTLFMNLRMIQVDVLGAVEPGQDSLRKKTPEEWNVLRPVIEKYILDHIQVTVNEQRLVNDHISGWQADSAGVMFGVSPQDTIMGIIRFTLKWPLREKVKDIKLSFSLLENVGVPVKWAMLMFPDPKTEKKQPHLVDRGTDVHYSFEQQAWVSEEGEALALSDTESLWGRIVLFVQQGFNQVTLEEVFSSSTSTRMLLIYILVAVVIGAMHALTPGHGKAIIGAYIISAKGTVRDAMILGLVTAISHTASVLILGVILLIAFGAVMPDNITYYLSAASGVIIFGIGIYLVWVRLKGLRKGAHHHEHEQMHPHVHHHDHDHHLHEEHAHGHHHHDHSHDYGHGHSHEVITDESGRISLWSNILMGISGGMVPCPSALVILFLAVSLNKLVLGLMLIIFFSAGLACTLTFLGILFAKGSKLVQRYDKSQLISKLPVVSAILIILLGIVMTVKSVSEILS